MGNEIPSNIQEDYRKILELSPDDTLPQEVVDAHCRYQRMNDLVGAGQITPKEMVMIALVGVVDSNNSDVTGSQTDNKFKKGDRIMALFEGKTFEGTFINYLHGSDEGKAKVSFLNDTAKYREVLLDGVTAYQEPAGANAQG